MRLLTKKQTQFEAGSSDNNIDNKSIEVSNFDRPFNKNRTLKRGESKSLSKTIEQTSTFKVQTIAPQTQKLSKNKANIVKIFLE